MKVHFTKMHGLGNDFILIDCMKQDCRFSIPFLPLKKKGIKGRYHSEFGELAKRLCNRRLGIGADQVILLEKSGIADFKMRIYNADGSEVEMCGNGIRCIARYIWDRGLSHKDVLEIETLAGVIKPEKAGKMVKVDMGEPIFEPEKIPVKINPKSKILNPKIKTSKLKHQISNLLIIDYPLKVDKRTFKITCVSIGNPHAVIIVKDVTNFPVSYYGPLIENHRIFPNRTNVEFIEVKNPLEIMMRVWERGSGETMACGTGASASVVVSCIKRLTERNVNVHLLGGDLLIEWNNNNHIYMTGPAEEVFNGTIEY